MVMVTSVTWSTPVNRSVSVNITNLVAGFISLFLRVLVPSFSIGMKLGVSPPLHTTSCQTYMNANIKVNHTLSAWVMESGSPGWCDRVLSCNLKIYYMLSEKKRKRRRKEGQEIVVIRLQITERSTCFSHYNTVSM